jgi:hypothetical protein
MRDGSARLRRRRLGRWRVAAAVVLLAAVGVSDRAAAAVPFVDIGAPPSGPLIVVAIGNELGCQVQHTGDTSFELYPPSTTPGDCGTFLFDGSTLFTPDLVNHGTSAASLGTPTPFSPVSQSAKTGAGTLASPFKVVTVVNAGAGLQLTETDQYIVGEESYRTDVAVRNQGGAAQSIIIWRAGDCYLQNSDVGYGFTGANGAVGCSATANNSPPNRIEEWIPITSGNSYLEDRFSTVWSTISSRTPFPNQCAACTTLLDNGAGLSWSATIQPGQSATFSQYTTFSPTGQAGPPPSASASPGPSRVINVPPQALGLPSNKQCIDRRLWSFTLHSPRGQRVIRNDVFVNGKLKVSHLGRALRHLTLRALPIGRFLLKIVDTTDQGYEIISKRLYHGCKKTRPHTMVKRPGRV